MPACTVIGGGLAGCEAAWQLARAGCDVELCEAKPAGFSPAHATPLLAELVCSNSLGGDDRETAAGLLKGELRRAGSLILRCADEARVPAGGALAVDRHRFARLVTAALALAPRVRLRRGVLAARPAGPVVVATGPLGFGPLARDLQRLLGAALHFYDAIAPIVTADSIDMERAFLANRWDGAPTKSHRVVPGGAAYINCPLSRDEYLAFVRALREGHKVAPHSFEEPRYFEGCLPIEVLAERGPETLAFGPMRPIGLEPPPGWPRPYAVLQLRPEDEGRSCYNLVGCQTRLTYPEQRRVFRLIPALACAEFERFGSIHRNSYVDAPRVLGPELEVRARPEWRLAGQVTGVEGYVESTAMGLLCGRLLAARLLGSPEVPPPPETALGALHRHLTRPRPAGEVYEPAAITYGLLPPLPGRPRKRDRRRLHGERAQQALEEWLARGA